MRSIAGWRFWGVLVTTTLILLLPAASANTAPGFQGLASTLLGDSTGALRGPAARAPALLAAVTPPSVGTLPGTPVPLSAAERAAGAVEVRQVAVTGAGAQRVALLVGRTADQRLCVGNRAFFRCLEPVDAQPAYVIGVFGGSATSRRWGALVGLAGPELERVEVMLQQGERRTLDLQPFADFPWRAFVVPPTGPNGWLPAIVRLFDDPTGRALTVNLGWVVSGCLTGRNCVRARQADRVAGDSVDAPIGEDRPAMQQAKKLALDNPLVRGIIGETTRLVSAPAKWTSCGGKFLGAAIQLELFRPVSIDGELPFVSFGKEKRGRAYAEGVQRLHVEGLIRILVEVDLNRGKVVSIRPTGDKVLVHSHEIVKQPTPAGPLDKAVCRSGD